VSELDPVRHGSRCPVHPSHRLALVGEAPGPHTHADMPLYPFPMQSAAGRLLAMLRELGWTRGDYLRTFARANLLGYYPGASFPVGRARPEAPLLAQRLAPRPLILLGRGVAMAFRFPTDEVLCWQDYVLEHTLVRAAIVPHPSGRNLWYNDPANRRAAAEFIDASARELGCENKSAGGTLLSSALAG